MSIEAVARAIAFTEDNLHEPLNVGAMADVAHYSLYHFCRVFSRHTGLSPYTYLVRRRLTLASEQVIASDQRIVRIAHEFGFDSHEGFSRAFARLFSITPIQARDRGWVAGPPRLPALTVEHLRCLERHQGLVPTFAPPSRGPGADVVPVPVQLTWPAEVPPAEPPTVDTDHDTATFELAGPDDQALVVDWLVHVWLMVAGYELVAPVLLIDRAGTRVTAGVTRPLRRADSVR